MKDKEYTQAHEDLAPEFELAHGLIEARVTAGFTQERLAERMDTTQSMIARRESGRPRPSTPTMEHLSSVSGERRISTPNMLLHVIIR